MEQNDSDDEMQPDADSGGSSAEGAVGGCDGYDDDDDEEDDDEMDYDLFESDDVEANER